MTTAVLQPLVCGRCGAPLPWRICNSPDAGNTCTSCAAPVRAHVFPAFLEALELGRQADAATPEQDANCFYHDDKRAVTACSHCGRLLCSLCDVTMRGDHLCPTCISRGKEKGSLVLLQSRRIMHDNIALILALAPLALGWLGLLLSPSAIFYAAFRWRSPGSLVPRTRIRFIIAILLAMFSLAGFVFILIAMVAG